ncbi:hypothetical protein FP66_02325 [Halomonas salina]|uniref:Abasic site processing protein n=1 Tax=Halomonas salina TaxID=42565 RepID=A0ABR4WV55_9GAMM|nr:hypothetical protein FP66_02325 [Halomonas salina]
MGVVSLTSERPDFKPCCAILTEPARGVAKAIHYRMPLVLDAENLAPWLGSYLTDRETLHHVIHHLPAAWITHWLVNTWVNRPN